jgi:hypothetical protein
MLKCLHDGRNKYMMEKEEKQKILLQRERNLDQALSLLRERKKTDISYDVSCILNFIEDLYDVSVYGVDDLWSLIIQQGK